jgi:hypothetical protein
MNRLGLAASILLSAALMVLAGCTLSSAPTTPAKMDVTQAYQTVAAKLTQASLTQIAQPVPTNDNPSQTPGVSPMTTGTPVSTPTTSPTSPLPLPTATTVCDRAAPGNPIDISIPDDTKMQPAMSFIKSWQLLNAGGCTWTTDYAIRFFYGELMGAPELIKLEREVQPGEQVIISVDFVAPDDPGTYQSNWKLQNAVGQLFGMGPNGDAPFWVRIEVLQVFTPTPTHTPTLTQSPSPSPSPTATSTPSVIASGMVTLAPGDLLDLSTAAVNSGVSDLAYIKDISNFHQLMPQSPAMMGVYGSGEPALTACKAANMSSAPIALESLSTGTYLCYQTQQGLAGWLLYKQYDEAVEAVTLDLRTWAVP